MRYFPLFLAMEGADIVIVGGGEAAVRKYRLVSRSAARIVIMAERLAPELVEAISEGRAHRLSGILDPAAFAGARFVIVSTGCAALDAAAADLARAAGALVNVVDRPALSDAIVPAIVDRDPVVVAIGTEGTAPVLARQIRSRLETWLEPSLGAFAARLGAMRGRVACKVAPFARRRFWEWAIATPRRLFADGDEEAAFARIEAALEIGAAGEPDARLSVIGDGERDLMTLRAVNRLQSADLVLHGQATSPNVLELARRDAARARLDFARKPARWHVERVARQAIASRDAGQNVVWLADRPHETAAALARLGARAEFVPGAEPFSAAVARAEDG